MFQRDPYSGNAFLPGESSSEEEEPLAELSKEELCMKIKSLKQKLSSTRKENSRLRQSLVMLQGKRRENQYFYLFVFLFLGPHPRHMEVPRLRVQSEL